MCSAELSLKSLHVFSIAQSLAHFIVHPLFDGSVHLFIQNTVSVVSSVVISINSLATTGNTFRHNGIKGIVVKGINNQNIGIIH